MTRAKSWQKSVLKLLGLFLFLACSINGKIQAQVITVPEKVQGKADRYIFIKYETDCDSVKWLITPKLEELDQNFVTLKPNVIAVIGDPGVYRLQMVGAKAVNGKAVISDIKIVEITIGNPPPVPPGPDPIPPGPGPDNSLIKAFQAVYGADTTPNKKEISLKLAALYKQGALFLDKTERSPSDGKDYFVIGTYKELFDTMKKVAEATGCSQKLVTLQSVISEQILAKGHPMVSPKGIEYDPRQNLKTLFNQIATALESLQ